jgi:hypothetical protein
MTITYQKLELLQTVQNLDAVQSEKVLDFIRELAKTPENDPDQQRVKTRAMKDIGQALLEIRGAL